MGSTLNRRRGGGLSASFWMAATLIVLAAPVPVAAQPAPVDTAAEFTAFEARVAAYMEMHKRLEGPLPPRMVTEDMDEVHRLMDTLRGRIRAARGTGGTQGWLITPKAAAAFRHVIGSTLTLADVVNVSEELAEHTPPRMARVRVNEPLPQDAPFVMLAPQLLRALPQLPVELRYVALGGALIVWDQHADLVVEVVPGLFDPRTYAVTRKLPSDTNH